MDWSKAKNILIVAFIITNIFLLYSIRNNIEERNYFYEVNEERIEDVVQILKEKNITVETDIPKQSPKLAVLTVEYESYDPEQIAQKFLEEYRVQEGEYINKNEKVKILNNNKLLVYEQKPEWFRTGEITDEKAKEIADAFIKQYGFMNENVHLWDVTKDENDRHVVLYSQKYNDMFLEDSYMKVVLDNVRVLEFERKWLEPKGVKTHKERVIPSTTALIMSIDDIKAKIQNKYDEAIITDIQLGYLLDISNFDSLIKWYDMESGDGSPYWRITLQDKEHKLSEKHIFVEAYE